MTAIKMIAFLLLGIGAFLVYGARFVVARLDKGKEEKEQAGASEKNMQPSELTEKTAGDEENLQPKIPSQMLVKVKLAGLVFILAGGVLVLIAFK